MQKIFLLIAGLCIYLFSFSQTPATSYRMTLGEEIKLKKGTADLDIVAADNTGLYLSLIHI